MVHLGTLSETDDEDDGTPEMIVQDLKSAELATQLHGVCVARRMLREQRATAATMLHAGLIAPLVDALDRDDCPNFQYRALGVLTQIAFGARGHTVAVMNSGAIPKLIAFLAYDDELAERAITTLGSFALHGAEARDAVLACGAVTAMLPYMRTDTPYWKLRTHVRVYSNFCSNNDEETLVNLELVSPALPHISDLLGTREPDILVNACTALTNITHGPDEYIEAVQAVPGLTARLVALLGHEASAVQEAALNAVGNMLAGTDAQVDHCLEANCLEHIVSLLRSSNTSLVKEAARAAGNILAGTHLQIQQALEKRILILLRNIIILGQPECQLQAACAISYLCSRGSAAQRRQLASRGVLPPYCALLAAPGRALPGEVLDGLYELIQAAERDDNVKPLCYLLDELDVIDQMQTLQEDITDENHRRKISEMNKIVRKHAREERAVTLDGKTFTATDIIRDLRSLDLVTYTRAARAANRILNLENAPVNAMLEAGIIVELLKALNSDDSQSLHFAATWAFYISAGSRKHRMVVMDSGAMPKLVALLAHGKELSELVGSFLGSMVIHWSEARDIVLACIRADVEVTVLRTYVQNYKYHCRQVRGQPLASLTRVLCPLPFISELLDLEDRIILEDVCWAFADLTSGPAEVIEKLQSLPRFTARLVALLGHEAAGIKEPALMAVGNMLNRTPAQADRCHKAGCLDHIIPILLNSEPALTQLAAQLATEILRALPSHIQWALEKDILPALRHVLVEGDAECRKQAGKAITCFCRNGSAAQLACVLPAGVLPPYCALLAAADRDHSLLDLVLNGLYPLIEAAKENGSLKAFSLKLDEIGVLDHLQRLMNLELDKVNRKNSLLLSVLLRRQAREEHVVIYGDDSLTLAEIVQDLKSEELATQKRAAGAALVMLHEPNSPRAAMLQAGIVAPLVAALDRYDCPNLQHRAICALNFITFDKRIYSQAVVKSGAVPKLIGLLRRGVGIPKGVCATLGNIVNKDIDSREMILELGALQAMLPYMRPGRTHPKALRDILKSCHMLCSFEMNFEVVAPVLPYIRDLLEVEDEEVLTYAAFVIQCIIDGPDERVAPVLAVPGLVARLVDLMSHDALGVQYAALGAVGNMLNGTDAQKQRILQMNFLTPLMRMFHNPANYDFKYNTLCALLNITTTKRRAHIVAIVEREVIPRLIALLAHEDLVVIRAAQILGNITLHGWDLRDIVLAHGAVPAMRPVMRPDKPVEVLRACVGAYTRFCRPGDELVELELVYPALPYIYKLLGIKDPDVLENACYAISYLMQTIDRIEVIQAMPGLMGRLVALIGHKAAEVKEAALSAITNIIIKGNITQVKRCLDADCLRHIACLLDCKEPSLVTKAILATDKISYAIHRDLIKPLREKTELERMAAYREENAVQSKFRKHTSLAIQTNYSSMLYKKALKELNDFKSGPRDCSVAIVESGVIAKLVGLLFQGSEITLAAATALGDVAILLPEVRDLVREKEAVPAMLAQMRPGTPLKQLKIYVQSLYGLFRNSLIEVDLLAPALPHISELLHHEDPFILETTCLILVNVMYSPEEDIRKMVQAEPGITESIVALLGHEATQVKIVALSYIVNMLARHNVQTGSCLEDSCLKHIVSLIQCSQPTLRQFALQAAANIFTKTQSTIQQFLEKGILAALAKILAGEMLEFARPAAMAICNFCFNGSAAQHAQLVSSDVLPPYCALLAVPDLTLADYVLEGLHVLFRFAVEDGNVKTLSLKYKEMGVFEKIELLQQCQIGQNIRRDAVMLNDMMLTMNDPDFIHEKKVFCPSAIIQELQSEDQGTKATAARAARHFFANLDFSRADLVESGIIALLVTSLDSGHSADLQYEAVRVLSKITSETSQYVVDAVNNGAIPKLIVLLSYGGFVAGYALWTIGNIACTGPGFRDLVLAHGAVRAMLPHMRADTPLDVLRTCVWACESLCCHNEESPEMIKCVSPALPQISEILNTIKDYFILEQACWVLKLINETIEGVEAVQAVPGLTEGLVALLEHDAVAVKRAAINAVILMFTGTKIHAERCIEAGCLERLVPLLRSSEPHLAFLALQATCNMLRFKYPRLQPALKMDLITHLVGIIADAEPNSSLQCCAAGALANFTGEDDREHNMAVVKSGAIPKLIALLAHGADVARPAVLALGHIAGVKRKIRDAVLLRGAVPAMLPHLRPGTAPELLKYCVWAYWMFCRHDRNNKRAVKLELVSPVLPHISELLGVEDEYVLNCACEALCCLVKTPEGCSAVCAVPGLVARLAALLRHETEDVKNAAFSVLIHFLSGTDIQVDSCIEANCVDHMISYLECRDPHLMQRSTEVMHELPGAEHSQVQHELGEEVLTPLMRMLAWTHKDQKRILKAIGNLCRRVSAEQRSELLSRGVLELYCALLAAPDLRVAGGTLEALQNLLQVATSEDNRKQLCLKLAETGVLNQMKKLREHEDEELKKKVLLLMETYFPEEGDPGDVTTDVNAVTTLQTDTT